MDLSECCNQRALSPIFKPIMEPLPVDNQFVVIFHCLRILTLHLESSEGRRGRRGVIMVLVCLP